MTASRASALISTLGSEPQVVTSALDLLLAQGEPVSQVDVLHTSPRSGPTVSAVNTVREAFSACQYGASITLRLHPILVDCQPTEDVETPAASAAAFRALYRLVRAHKQQERQVHLCIAGGRKNLAIFGMVTAQLLFDASDCLWHLYSAGEFLNSKRLHPQPGDEVHLLAIPVLLRDYLSPALTHLRHIDDPYEALQLIEQLDLNRKLESAASFIQGALTGAERRVVALLVLEGLSDQEIASRLLLSPRTVEQHLRSAYAKAAAHWELETVNRTQLVALLHIYFSLPGSEKFRGKSA